MEAFLLTLDVIFMILLMAAVTRFTRTGAPKSLGLFAYREEEPPAQGETDRHA